MNKQDVIIPIPESQQIKAGKPIHGPRPTGEHYFYMTFVHDKYITLDEVLNEYKYKYHGNPDLVFSYKGLVWAGPVPVDKVPRFS